LRGVVRVEVLTDDPSRFDAGSVLHVEGSDTPLTVREVREDGPGLLVTFEEVADRTAADGLRNRYLEGEVDAGRELPEGAHYWHEVIGATVSTTTGEALGEITDVFRVGESEIYVVNGPRGEILVPAIESVVKELAPAEKRVVVDAEALGLDDATSD
jgi:16S rRNA processing protein RimM